MRSSKALLLRSRAIPTVALLVAAVLSPCLYGQVCERVVTASPPNPTNRTPVTLSFLGFVEGFCSTLNYRIQGNVITIENNWECVTQAGFAQRQVSIGLLAPGSYYVRVVEHDFFELPPLACGTFTVAAAPPEVPALAPSLVALLGTCLALAGVFLLRR